MVGTGARALDDLEASIGPVGGGDDGAFEVVGAELARAGAGDEDAAGLDELQGELVEIGVFRDAGFVLAAVDEFWRIGDDKIPSASVFDHGADPSKGVGVGELDACRVEIGVALGHFDGGFVEVDSGHIGGSGECGGDGEAARVAAEVEHRTVLGVGREKFAVIALIAEEAGFVAGAEINFVANAVFADFHRADIVGARAAAARNAFDAGEFRVDADDHALRVEAFVENRDPALKALPCGEVGDFHREDIGELVGDDARHEIRIAMNCAVGFACLVEREHFSAH